MPIDFEVIQGAADDVANKANAISRIARAVNSGKVRGTNTDLDAATITALRSEGVALRTDYLVAHAALDAAMTS